MKLASSEARNSAALATSQAVPILPRSGTLASRAAATSARGLPGGGARAGTALGAPIGARLAGRAGAGVHRDRRIHQPRQDAIGADAVGRVLDRDLLGEGDH